MFKMIFNWLIENEIKEAKKVAWDNSRNGVVSEWLTVYYDLNCKDFAQDYFYYLFGGK